MQNVVSLDMGRPRAQHIFPVPRSGARILFFTGVRYCRDDAAESQPAVAAYRGASQTASERVLDAAAH